MASKKEGDNSNVKVGVGIALAALAGAYFLFGTNEGKKTQNKIKGWMVKAKGEVMEKLEGMKDINEAKYHKAIEQVTNKYKKLKNIENKEVDALVKDLKKHWTKIKKEISKEVPKSIKKSLK